jgi:hypothetical protein
MRTLAIFRKKDACFLFREQASFLLAKLHGYMAAERLWPIIPQPGL